MTTIDALYSLHALAGKEVTLLTVLIDQLLKFIHHALWWVKDHLTVVSIHNNGMTVNLI